MLRFDRVKIVTSSEYLEVPKVSDFIVISNKKNGTELYKYNSRSPYFLAIMINPISLRASIEFTGKILLDKYPQLISIETIDECLNRINEEGICQLNVEKIIENSKVSKLDITIDLDIPIEDLKNILSMAIKDPKKWIGKIRKRNGIDIAKDVKSNSTRKERISFYNKGEELNRSTNIPFIQKLKDPLALLNYFEGKTRVEYNLTSGVMIKKILEIDSLELLDVFSSKTPVIGKVVDTIFDRTLLDNLKEGKLGYLLFDTIQDYYQYLLLEKFDDDEKAVEQVFRYFYSPTSNYRSKRVKIRKIKSIGVNNTGNKDNQVHLFDSLVEKIKNAA